MKNKSKKERRSIKINGWVAFGIFFILSLVLYGKFLTGSRMLFGSDWLSGSYANRVWMERYIKQFQEIAYWNIYIFSGMPTMAAFFGDIITPALFAHLILPVHLVWAWRFVIVLSLSGLGIYHLMRKLGALESISLAGGVFYMLSAFLPSTTYAGHLNRLITMSFFPFVVYFLLRGIETSKPKFFIFLGGLMGYIFLNGHPQMAYYGVLYLFAIFLFYTQIKGIKLSSGRFWLLVGLSLVSAVIAILAYGFYLFPVLENLKFAARGAERGYAYATSWSLPPEEILNLLTPHFSGLLDSYWGRNYFKLHSEYMGIIPLMFAVGVIALKYKKSSGVKFLFWSSTVMLLFAFGKYTPVFHIFYYIPGMSKFRGPSLMFYLFNFNFIILSSIFLNSIFRGEIREEGIKKYTLYSYLALVILFMLFLIFKGPIINMFSSLIQGTGAQYSPEMVRNKLDALYGNYNTFLVNFLLGLVFLIVAYLSLRFYMQKKLNITYTLSIIVLVFIVDLYRVDFKFIKEAEPPSVLYAPDEVVKFLKKDTSLYRVFPVHYEHTQDGLLAVHDIQSIGGYTGNPPRRYQEFIGAGKSVMFIPRNLITYPHMLNLLDVKYLISYPLPQELSRFDERTRNIILSWRRFFNNFEPIFRGNKYVIYRNNNNFGRVYFVEGYEVMKSEEALSAIEEKRVNLRKRVILEINPEVPYIPDSLISDSIDYNIEITHYRANEMKLIVDLPHDGFLVFAENYHPAWKVLIDGKPSEVYLANYGFRAVYCPQGRHDVRMYYSSNAQKLGWFSTFLAFLVVVVSAIPWRKRK